MDDTPIAIKSPSKPISHSHAPALFTGDSEIKANDTCAAIGGDQYNNAFVSQPEDKKSYLAMLKPVNREGYYVRPCMEGTRRDVLETVDQWLDNVDEHNILWLQGGPGSGKSTIASSLVSKFTKNGRLGSSFFFKRGDATLSDPTAVWCTVAHDLAQCDDSFARNLVRVLKGRFIDPGWLDISLHFRYLVKEPLIRSFTHTSPIIVIDALDECEADDSKAGIFIDTIMQWSTLPGQYKLIVTGRNKRMPDRFYKFCKLVTLSTGSEANNNVRADIRHFFEVRLAEFGDSLGPELQDGQVSDDLTTRAAGLFIWAEVAMRFVDQGVHAKRLRHVLNGGMGGGDDVTKLYQQILEDAFPKPDNDMLEAFNHVVAAIVLAKVPFHADDLAQFVEQPEPLVKLILTKLSSVISIGKDRRCRFNHISFSEFLCDSNQCPEQFYIGRREEIRRLSMACFRLMRDGLRFNICDLETSSLLNAEVSDLSDRVHAQVTGALLYSCRFWALHFRDAITNRHDEEVMTEVKEFFDVRFLYWLEVMSLVNEVAAASAALSTIVPLIEDLDINLSAFVRDASHFISTFYTPISESTPHIYISALPFSPTNSLVWQHYKHNFPNILSLLCGREENWPASTNVSAGHTSSVTSVTFSPDGTRVASGSWDKTIRIWDAQTGQVIGGPFEGHVGSVLSVAFSPDGTRLASGSDDRTIRIWDAQTGQVITGPFIGHTDSVNSVVVSPDGMRVISGSWDNVIRDWDIQTGQAITAPLEGHTHCVNSVVISPDGKRVASGSEDQTIRIWDAWTGQVIASPFEGHTDAVTSVTFSPDGKRVASGSSDRTIRIWDAQTSEVISLLECHTDCVNSVVFSPDGRRVASGSQDTTIRIWDAQTGRAIIDPFVGHSEGVSSVAFSPDGMRVVSGSFDGSIRIWDVQADAFEGDALRSITSDDTMFASGSVDSEVHGRNLHMDKIHVIGRAQSPSYFRDSFEMHKDGISCGWVCSLGLGQATDTGVLFWVPPLYRKGLCAMETLLVLGERTTRVGLSRFVYGKSWAQCYSPTTATGLSPPSGNATSQLPQPRSRLAENMTASNLITNTGVKLGANDEMTPVPGSFIWQCDGPRASWPKWRFSQQLIDWGSILLATTLQSWFLFFLFANLYKYFGPGQTFVVHQPCKPPITTFQPWEIVSIIPDLDGNPAPIEYTLAYHKPHQLSLIDIDALDMRLSVYVDGQLLGLTSDFQLNKSVNCGEQLNTCIDMGFSAGAAVVPAGHHTVKIVWIGKEFLPDTSEIEWGGERSRRLMWMREYCS